MGGLVIKYVLKKEGGMKIIESNSIVVECEC